jgi:Base plate wedge protein 53.
MAKINYPTTSPYAATPQLSWRIGRYEHRSISPMPGDTEIIVQPQFEHRPDRLSYDLYGTPEYYWVFMLRNMNLIRDPIWDLKAGMKIMVPSIDTLRTIFG